MRFTTNLKNIRCGAIPDGVVVKIWLWVKFKNVNWAIFSEYKEEMK